MGKLSRGELADLLGNSIRIHRPTFEGLGRRNDEQSKQLRRAYSRKALKALEEPADAVASGPKLAIEPLTEAISYSFDRAGLLAAADVSAGLGLALREVGSQEASGDTAEALAAVVLNRADLKELMAFGLSDEFFRLRQRIGVSLG